MLWFLVQLDTGYLQLKFEAFLYCLSVGNVDAAQKAEENAPCLNLLPFEFIAIEACLEAACTSLDEEAKRLEQEAHPALDKLTSKINTLNLERVSQIKSRLVAITGRVQKLLSLLIMLGRWRSVPNERWESYAN